MYKKPVIAVLIRDTSEEILKELLAGIEEEGIPYEVMDGKQDSSAKMASEGADISALNVGIGVYKEYVSIHIRNMPSDKPLFSSTGRNNKNPRTLGANAARYVKGIAFKNMEQVMP